MTFSEFCKKYQGRKVDYDGAYGFQCTDLFRQYAKDVWNIPHTGAIEGAKDLWLKYDQLPLEQEYLLKVDKPVYGDAVVFGATPANKYGHVALFIVRQDNNILVFEQNGFTQDGAKYVWRSTQEMLGALRKRNG